MSPLDHATGPVSADAILRTRPGALLAVRARLHGWSAAESRRLILWAPVAVGAGAAFYLSLNAEPPALAAPLIFLICAAASAFLPRARLLARTILLIALGFSVADWRTAMVAAPQLARALTPRTVTGVLLSVDESPKLRRLIIALQSVDGLAADQLPKRARLSWRGKEFDALPGDRISLRAGLSPPPAPSVPGGFDYARQLYFQKIGALGYVVSMPAVLERPSTLTGRAGAAIESARLALTRRILAAAPGDGGALVAATITGKREAISEEAEAQLRDSGLAHLIAISGLNMALATGIIFGAVRLTLAFIPPIALRYPVKKWAACAALLGGLLYLLISGGDWSAERAFIMTSIFFIAILVDRRALSLRNVAIAALVILLISPEAVIHPGFQMSFAAVTALIAAYEWYAGQLDPDRSFSWPARLWRYFCGVTATDIVASTATGPFAIYHFNRAAIFGLPANIVSIPIMGFWVMPMAMIALLFLPFGLDAPLWRLAAAGVDAVMWIAAQASSWPGAVRTFAQWPPLALVVLTLGGLWLCLQSAPWRLAGLAALPIALLLAGAVRPADLFVSSDGTNAGLVLTDHSGRPALALFRPRKDKFEAGVWKEQIGADADSSPTLAIEDVGRCDRAGCVAALRDRQIAVTGDPLGLADDCARADLVVALFPVSRPQKEACATSLVDRRDAWNGGALAIWLGPDRPRVVAVNDLRGKRPWTAERRTNRLPQTARAPL